MSSSSAATISPSSAKTSTPAFPYQTVKDLNLKDKIILLRVDYNVPLSPSGEITDDLRIRASLPTLKYLLTKGVKSVIIVSHLGRPKGVDPSFSLTPVANRLRQLLPGVPIDFSPHISPLPPIITPPDRGIILLENLRFNPGEKANDLSFAQALVAATGAQIFVEDGFGVIHRETATTSAITTILPAVAGLLLENEITNLSKLTTSPDHPFTVLIGGAKVEDKAPLIEKFLPIADHILVGGKIAAAGYSASTSKITVATDFANPEKTDIGPTSLRAFLSVLASSRTVLWNGTLGQTENPALAKGSAAIATALGQLSATTIICGGDTTAFVENFQSTHQNLNLNYTLISTGGGASLSFLTGQPLPGLTALRPASA